MSKAAKSFITSVKSDTTVEALDRDVRRNIMDSLRQQHHRATQHLKTKFPTFFATAKKKSQEIDKKISKVSTESVITTEQENSKEVPEDPAKEEDKYQVKFPIVEEKVPIVEEKFHAAGEKLQTAPIKQKINRAIEQSRILKELKQKFLDLISAPDLPWTFGETLDFDTFQITFNVKTK
jgi:hypothetical protein